MNADEFNKVLATVLGRTEAVLGTKAGEYATDTDRLHNFKNAAVIRASTPAQALGGMMVKHTISVYDMINSGKSFPLEVWDEKITDHINYLVLLRAIVEEQAQIDEAFNVTSGTVDDSEKDSLDLDEGAPSVDKIRFSTRHEAEDVLTRLSDLINVYQQVSVADLYDLIGVKTANFSDSRWGWENITAAHVTRARSGYSLELPLPKSLHQADDGQKADIRHS
jgi:hypothetical protein